MPIGWHGCLDGLGFVHVKLLQHVIGVLGLTYECAILELLDIIIMSSTYSTQTYSSLL
jgi:hypothetical protein